MKVTASGVNALQVFHRYSALNYYYQCFHPTHPFLGYPYFFFLLADNFFPVLKVSFTAADICVYMDNSHACITHPNAGTGGT